MIDENLIKRMAEARAIVVHLAAGAITGLGRRAMQERIETERAVIQLIAVTPHADKAMVTAEVARRTELMGEKNAHLSVYDDVVSGRWPR